MTLLVLGLGAGRLMILLSLRLLATLGAISLDVFAWRRC